jgi:hypothetical protein
MGRLRNPNEMSDVEIQRFFQDYWGIGELHEVVRKDPVTGTISSGFPQQSPEWYEQCIRLASNASCCLCGKYPSGDDTTVALVTYKQPQTCVMGVCAKCAQSTVGQSSMRVFYHAWVAVFDQGVNNKFFTVVGGQVFVSDQGASMP